MGSDSKTECSGMAPNRVLNLNRSRVVLRKFVPLVGNSNFESCCTQGWCLSLESVAEWLIVALCLGRGYKALWAFLRHSPCARYGFWVLLAPVTRLAAISTLELGVRQAL